MKLVIQQRSETPIYEQIYSQIVTEILNGSAAADECLPSIRVVSRELCISVIPVKTAYDMLERDGYIYAVQGKGCFVKKLGDEQLVKKLELVENKARELAELINDLNLPVGEAEKIIGKILK
ncbi:MAG: GntR family transcriptional regulator [Corallococcus sp.]|nr:GntR family transcriptional regulator [Bacillota bacterium]MCM1534047.1 GntR family transcriptional regulator [Corallococcus sp.]